jgi:hypothetical protein
MARTLLDLPPAVARRFADDMPVPELTRGAGIKLNRRVSLRRHCTRVLMRPPAISQSPDLPWQRPSGEHAPLGSCCSFRELPSEIDLMTYRAKAAIEPKPDSLSGRLKRRAILIGCAFAFAAIVAMAGWFWFLGWVGMHFVEWLLSG